MSKLQRTLFRGSRSRQAAATLQPSPVTRPLRYADAPHHAATADGVSDAEVSRALADLEAAIAALEGPVAARRALAAGN